LKAGFRWLEDFFNLLYPKLCLACGKNLPPTHDLICLSCEYQLPKTKQHEQKENAFTEIFWGRVRLETGAALYYFSKAGRVQRLIHQLKYDHKPAIGQALGRMYGRLLREQEHYQQLDAIVPVPLHPRKQHQRGYNQAAAIGSGLAESLQLPHYPNALERPVYAESQTRKSRQERLQNAQTAFRVKQPELLRGKHLLLVDDVLTTGATLEACASQILELPATKISLLTLAMASD
jgi:ComF family protein